MVCYCEPYYGFSEFHLCPSFDKKGTTFLKSCILKDSRNGTRFNCFEMSNLVKLFAIESYNQVFIFSTHQE